MEQYPFNNPVGPEPDTGMGKAYEDIVYSVAEQIELERRKLIPSPVEPDPFPQKT